MSCYQSVTLTKLEGKTLTLEVEEVHADMWTIHEMLDHCPLGRDVTLDEVREDLPTDLFQLFNGAAILVFSNSDVAAEVTVEDSWNPSVFVRTVRMISATPIETSSSGFPQYRATLEVELRTAELAAPWVRWVGKNWSGYAYVDGDLDDMFG